MEKICSPGHAWRHLLEKLNPLPSKRKLKPCETRDIAPRLRQASNKALTDWITYTREDYRYGAGRPLKCCHTWRSNRNYQVRQRGSELSRMCLDALGVGASPPIVNLQVATFVSAVLLHTLSKRGEASFCFRIVRG